jgi:hypothetical protein
MQIQGDHKQPKQSIFVTILNHMFVVGAFDDQAQQFNGRAKERRILLHNPGNFVDGKRS